jgi:hypothetical protein
LRQHLRQHTIVGRKRWYVTDIWENHVAIPVYVAGINGNGEILAIWELGGGDTQDFLINDPAKLHKKRLKAEREASRKNTFDKFVSERSVCNEI